MLVFCLRAKRSGVGWSCKKYLLQCLILHIILCKWQCPHPNPSHCEGFCRTFHVPSGVPVQRSISERSVSYPMCFVNLPLPQQSSLSFQGCQRFGVRYLLSRLLAMSPRYGVSFYLVGYRWSLRWR